MSEPGFNTRAIHGDISKPDLQRSIRYPVYANVAYDFETSEDIAGAFTGDKPAHVYSRSSNPTVEAFERKITSLENGHAAVAMSSGMAAISNIIFNLLENGDNLLASPYLFGNTYSLFKHTLPAYGIETRFFNTDKPESILEAADGRTRLVFFETISNPQMVVPDIRKITEIAKAKNLIVVVDSTVTSPFLFRTAGYDVDLVMHSTTKYISGGATSVGGVLVDMGRADWGSIPSLQKFHDLGKNAFIARLRKEVYRNLGACLSPQAAYFQSLGLETLSLRIERSCSNTLHLASFLEGRKEVVRVNYPGLTSSPYHPTASTQFNGMFGGILSFELPDKETCFKFQDSLKLIRRATNLNDNVSLVIHPSSTIYAEFTPEEKAETGITDGMIRFSVGIEDVADLQEDLAQALDSIK